MFDLNLYIELAKTFGFGLAQTGLVVFLLWKIATNHLKHISDDIRELKDNVNLLSVNVTTNITEIKERLAKVEGQLE